MEYADSQETNSRVSVLCAVTIPVTTSFFARLYRAR